MRRGKRVIELGRFRLAVMYGSRYRFGFNLKRASWAGNRPVGFTAGLGLCVLHGLVRSKQR